jgi:P-type Ca2+ transporter type 2C
MSDSNSTNLLASNDAGEEAHAEDKPPSTHWYLITPHEIAQALHSDRENGLSSLEAKSRLQRYGPNTLTATPHRSVLAIFIAQFKSLIVVLLLAAAGLAFLLNETIEGFAILVVVVLNAIIGFLTELRAEQAITALQKQTVPIAHVLRDGEEHQIPAAELVPGDLVVLAAGGRVPADGRIVESVRLQLQEAALTGESLPVTQFLRKNRGVPKISGDHWQ